MTIAIIGAGAMGSLFGGKLHLAGYEVALVEINTAHIDAVRQHGLRLETDDEDVTIWPRIGTADDFSETASLIIIFTKTQHSLAALSAAQHLIGPETLVLTLQNGLGNGTRVADIIPADRMIIGTTDWPADMRGPGWVSSHGSGQVKLWSLDGQNRAHLHTVAHIFDAVGLQCDADPSVITAIWTKVAFNAAMNSIAAVTGFTVGEMADDPELRALAHGVAQEVALVAQAHNVAIAAARVIQMIDNAFANHRSHKPSMLQDMLAGRSTEIDSINGAVVEHAEQRAVAVPITRTLLRLIKARERQSAGT